MTGRLLEQLTITTLVKISTFNYNLPLFFVLNCIYHFDVTVNRVPWFVEMASWIGLCLIVFRGMNR